MSVLFGIMSVLCWLQIPPPSAGSAAPNALRDARRGIQEQEAKELAGLAGRLAGKGDSQAASEVRRGSGQARGHGVASRLMPLPEVVSPGPRGRGLASVASGAGN